ncbi:MarR family transcriptional regulator [Granulicella sp. 5B5]|uniref:winged helix-turn-helix transcriptional regulator n=1 Tax=Granulicella sp. 5B5 TaxID=1617967 RepID=UPI0015F71EBE|nr:helix-turn-helix domain-containing protein [Granulicella sp. 5B5]QMV18944.1 MarR family transcriptional regulator [Granulicella sp. 5B5]
MKESKKNEKKKLKKHGKKADALHFQAPDGRVSSPEVEQLVTEIIGRVADKWTMLLLEALAQHGVVRFSKLAELVAGISQKMLTQTLRQMEADGFVTRTVYPVVPPRVEYALTPLGESLGEAFCSVWLWAEKNYEELGRQRAAYRERLGLAG